MRLIEVTDNMRSQLSSWGFDESFSIQGLFYKSMGAFTVTVDLNSLVESLTVDISGRLYSSSYHLNRKRLCSIFSHELKSGIIHMVHSFGINLCLAFINDSDFLDNFSNRVEPSQEDVDLFLRIMKDTNRR